ARRRSQGRGGAGRRRSPRTRAVSCAEHPPTLPRRHPPLWRMSRDSPPDRLAGMRIEIDVEPGPPPSGVVSVDGGGGRRFDGWLGLLRLLAGALDPQAPAGAAGGLGGEVAPRGDP